MKSFVNIYLLFIVSLLIGCTPQETLQEPPRIEILLSPESGLTTTNFSFDASKSWMDDPKQNQLFLRFDWNNDGVWDVPFTDKQVVKHRFLKPGHYEVVVLGLDLNGMSDTARLQISITQGYSEPHPELMIRPQSGTTLTLFTLDGSLTHDDEDSLETLQFRWDFTGDGYFDTGFSPDPVAYYQYGILGSFNPMMEVQDPKGLIAKVQGLVSVNNRDTSIFVDFRWDPVYPTTNQKVVFNGGSSVDPRFPDKPLKYKWDWQSDGIFDMIWQDDSIISNSFTNEGPQLVTLQVMNHVGLIDEVVKEVHINHQNQPPDAIFEVSADGGGTFTEFRFDNWDSRDQETPPSQLMSRWDWNGDGLWDTEYTTERVILHTFSEQGMFLVNMQVMDSGGLTDLVSRAIAIGPGLYETGIFLDQRGTSGYEYYGTVRIGNLWWFARNLNVQDFSLYNNYWYQNNPDNSHWIGCLYPPLTIRPVCPDGWRIPTRNDWEELFSQFADSTLFADLIPGGKSNLNLGFGGMGDFMINSVGYFGRGAYGYYWSQTGMMDQAGLSRWAVTIDLKGKRVITGFKSNKSVLAVRCVKDH